MLFRRLYIAWLSLRSVFLPKWLTCRVVWHEVDGAHVPTITLNDVEVPMERVLDCYNTARGAYMNRGLFCEQVAYVEFEVMSTSATYAYFSALHSLD